MQLRTQPPEFHAVKPGLMTIPSEEAAVPNAAVIDAPLIDLGLDETLEKLAGQIRAAYAAQLGSGGTTIAAIIEVGRLCQKARKHIAKLGHELPRVTQLERATGFSNGSISRYCKIADNSVITNAKNHHRLPSSVFSLHALCELPDLQTAIDSGIVVPDMGRDSILKLIGTSKGEETETSPLTTVEAFTVSFPAKTWEKSYGSFENDLRELLKGYEGAQLSYGRPVHHAKTETLRKQAQEHIERLLPGLPEDSRKLKDLVDNALAECERNGISVFIEETGKKGWQLSPDWKLLPKLCKALEMKPTEPVYRSTIIKQAKAKEIVCRLIPLASLNREIDLWIALLNFCNNNQRSAQVKKIYNKSVEVLEGAKATPEAERTKEIARQIYCDVRHL